MGKLFVFWNYFWWNYHLDQARRHDARIESVIVDWKLRCQSGDFEHDVFDT